ncbi:MAG: DEAD/DEAH box helicase [Treponema sp.]|jgi:ATP-dependent Lhr-like helicase|nr:DEAD/DEAH box helicase [Treponema sp.]
MAYSRLAPFIREYIYSQKWSAMRRIQEAAVHEVFDGTGHILIASGTASGKTEAAFLPLLSILANAAGPNTTDAGKPGPKPLVLCVSPLKALINDQYERLGKIIAGENIGLWRWHGDAPENHKKRFLADPGGILLITPEALEALLLRQAGNIGRVFAGLVFVVIDEVHIFMGSERGRQLICQLARIERECTGPETENRAGRRVRRLGLSATLWDYDGGLAWLSQGTEIPAVVISEPDRKRRVSLAVDYFNGGEAGASGNFYRALYEQCRNRRAIVFANSRLEAEQCAASLRRAARGESGVFYVHHGSVASPFRDEAEEKLKSGEGPSVVVATATLELGIDIGDLDRILQIGPPWSVSAFVQRLGRSGRRNGRPEMYFSVYDHAARGRIESAGPELSSIPWDLLRTVAVIELFLGEKWIEPPEEKPLPYSLFAHELLAVLGSLGEHSAAALGGRLFALPPFARSSITRDDFALILRHFRRCGYVDKTAEGGLILGVEGEKIVNRYGFYSVFPGEETFRVLFEGREMGTVNFAPPPGTSIAVAGRLWTVENVDGGRREIRVKESEKTGQDGSRLWGGGGGHIHRRIAEKVKAVLSAARTGYAYLSPAAGAALERGRRLARETGILEKAAAAAPRKAGDLFTRLYICPWLGASGMRTVDAFLKNSPVRKNLALLSCEREGDFYFSVETKLEAETFIAALAKETEAFPDDSTPVPAAPSFSDKYDYLLPEELLVKQYAANTLDGEALAALRSGL